MAKLLTFIAFTVGLLVAAIAVGGGFSAAPVEAHEETATVACPSVAGPLDEGYGVYRTVMRPDCAVRR
jgi:hypothetical protein